MPENPTATRSNPSIFFKLATLARLGIQRAQTRRDFTSSHPTALIPGNGLSTSGLTNTQANGFGSQRKGTGSRETARVKTYGDIVTEYEFHPESKCADGFGDPCSKQTIGLLQRRHVKIDLIKCIGKESNSLEEVGEGLVH